MVFLEIVFIFIRKYYSVLNSTTFNRGYYGNLILLNCVCDDYFYNCKNLKRVKIGAGITSLERGLFTNCDAIETYEVSDSNQYFSSTDGILFAELLTNNGIEVMLNETKGTIHGFDIVQKAETTIMVIDDRIAFMSCFFNKK